MNKDFDFGYQPDAKVWKALIGNLKSEGFYPVYFPETDKDGLFVDFKYVTVSNGKWFFYLQNPELQTGIEMCVFQIVSPYEKKQMAFPRRYQTYGELLDYMNNVYFSHPDVALGCPTQRIYLLELYGMDKNKQTDLWKLRNRIAGNRERNILGNLSHIEMIRHDNEYEVLRFWSFDDDWFDYECKSHRITG